MSFTAQDVMRLREMTQAGMMDCKKALTETNGDFEKAATVLRQKGIASAAKRAGKIAAEGMLAAKVSPDGKSAVLVEVNAQTDFVARNDNFRKFVAAVVDTALANKTSTIDKLLSSKIDGVAVSEKAAELSGTIGEKIDVRRVAFLESSSIIGAYVHPVGFKVGTLVAFGGAADAAKANDIAMHIAAANPAPEFLTREGIPAAEIEKEKQIELGKEDLKGKPPEIAQKIVEGRVNKILAARVLVEQPFIKDPGKKVSEYLGSATQVEKFILFNLGEGIEKKQDNLAAEVAAMIHS